MPFGGSLLLPLRPFVEDAFPSTLPQEVDNRLSVLLEQMLPGFVIDDHQTFVDFLRAYLEYNERFGNPRAEAVRLETYSDIDNTLEDFIKYFKKTYLESFPEDLYAGLNTTAVIKNIKTFYAEKGNPRSLDLLFRILYNSGAVVSDPSNKLIRLSDSDYSPKVSIKTTREGTENILDYIGGTITQKDNIDFSESRITARGFIDSIIPTEQDGLDLCEIFITGKLGDFKRNLPIIIQNEETPAIKVSPLPVIKTLLPTTEGDVIQDGENYRVGDKVILKKGDQIIATLAVTSVSTSGEIITISEAKESKILEPSASYSTQIISAFGTGASLKIISDVNILNLNSFESDRSKTSTDSKIQNNFSVQDYAYKISSFVDLKKYANIVKSLFHPAGRLMLGEYIFEDKFEFKGFTFDIDLLTLRVPINPVIGNYLPYTIGTTADLRGDTFGNTYGDYYPSGYDGLTAAVFGNYDSIGNAITHDPFNFFNVDGQPVPIGKDDTYAYGATDFSKGKRSPEYIYNLPQGEDQSLFLSGYTLAQQPQPKMVETDSITFDFYNVFRHPRVLIGVNETAQSIAKINPNYTKNISDVTTSKFSTVQFAVQTLNAGGSVNVGEILTQELAGLPEARAEVTAVEEKFPSEFVGGKEWNAKVTTQRQIDDDISNKTIEIQNAFALGKDAGLSDFINTLQIRNAYILNSSFTVGGVTITPTFTADMGIEEIANAGGRSLTLGAIPKNTKPIKDQLEPQFFPLGPTRDDGTKVKIVTAKVLSGALSNQTDVRTSGGSSFSLSGGDIDEQGTVLVPLTTVDDDLSFGNISIDSFLNNMKRFLEV